MTTPGGEEKELLPERGHEKTQSTVSGRPFGERFGFGYFKDTFDWFTGKGKKKDKSDGSGDGSTPTGEECSKLYLNHVCMQRFVKNHHLRQIIPLPPEIDLNEWLASQIVPMFQNINHLYGTVTEFCMQSACPSMTAPNGMVYIWIDEKGRKSKCSAPQYIDYVTVSIEKLIKDDAVFPTKHGLSFPSSFDVTTRKIQRLLFHVLAHIYHAHFDAHVQLGTHVYLNGLFAHFILFSQHFNLIEPREFDVLRDLIDKLLSDTGDVIPETVRCAAEILPESVVAAATPGKSKSADRDQLQPGPGTKLEQSKVICDTSLMDATTLAMTGSNPLRMEAASPLKVRELLSGIGQNEGSVI